MKQNKQRKPDFFLTLKKECYRSNFHLNKACFPNRKPGLNKRKNNSGAT